jgi:hypothetical protein
MQFIQNGPDIPDRLMQFHEEGRVVFFCGAGISYPAGLPGFAGLVERLYSGLGTTPTEVERAAIKKQQFDTAIGLLEGRIAGKRLVVRQDVARILTPSSLAKSKTTATHRALLTLSRDREGKHRLVTTNFDRIFETVLVGSAVPRSTAPQLPVPKRRWDGLVYLHGLLPVAPASSDLDSLVLSSGDFGLAYLIERWAARFVSELVRNFVVCFVGYSINDPVLRYMMDALAADRLLGEPAAEVFAFGSYSRGQEREQRLEWAAKNVTPILYQEHAKHHYLHKTLQAWAAHYRDGISANERIVSRHASNVPAASTRQDDIIGRILWALTDPSGVPARRFATLDPAPSLDWLEPFAQERFGYRELRRFGIQPNDKENETLRFSLLSRYARYDVARSIKLVGDGREGHPWDRVMHEIARWTLRHLNNPNLLLWFASRGGKLDPILVRMISQALRPGGIPVSLPMRKLWSVLLSGRVR